MGIEFKDFSDDVIKELEAGIIAGLYEAGAELTSQVAKNSRVDSGQLKGSWAHKVDESKLEAVIGSPLENSIWEEFGTGEHALNNDGRKGWKGKKPSRAFFKAYTSKKSTIINLLQKKVEDALK